MFVFIWYTFLVLEYCTMKNLATLAFFSNSSIQDAYSA
jgi:hypothetical protein